MINLLTERKYFGKVKDEQINKFRSDLKGLFPNGTILKSIEEQEAELQACISALSGATTNVDLADKMGAVNLKSND